MTLKKEISTLYDISASLLKNLEPEPVYLKRFIESECERFKKDGWVEQEGDRPWINTFEKEKYTLKVAFVHARKGEHITGADLAFELKDKKIIFIQSKKVGPNGRIHFNRFQLQKLIDLEEQICGLFPFYSNIDIKEWTDIIHNLYHRFEKFYLHMNPQFFQVLPFLPKFYSPFRATYYHLIMTNLGQIEERIFHTSEISFTIAGKKSVSQKEFINYGIKSDEFQKLFWECKIGGPDIRESIKENVFYLYSLFTNRFIIWLDIDVR